MSTELSAKVISFPSETRVNRGRKSGGRMRSVDGVKYFNAQQIKLLRRTARDQAEIDEKKGKVTGIREWMVIDLLTSTGLRVSEAANLRCGDLKIGFGMQDFHQGGERASVGSCRHHGIAQKAF